jgi:starch phosphorylase
VFAGKAHPADDQGKSMIRQIVQFSADPLVRNRLVFVEDYDIAVARLLYQGVDVWLNNPRRPLEACGTSGEKAALNGALNCSIRDGWWDEMFDGDNGWAISSAETYSDVDQRDQVEAESLFELLERRIVPLFYERSQGPVPRGWVRRMKSSLRTLGPRVGASRMVRDYVEQMYEPVAARAVELGQEKFQRARSLAQWKARVTAAWDAVHVDAVNADVSLADLGSKRDVEVIVRLGPLTAEDVAVQLAHGAVATHGELVEPSFINLSLSGPGSDGTLRYTGSFPCERSGRYGFAVRVVPQHHDLANPVEMGRVTWA